MSEPATAKNTDATWIGSLGTRTYGAGAQGMVQVASANEFVDQFSGSKGVGKLLAGSWAIDLTNVSKMYKGKVHALRGVDVRVASGEIFGLLGPNGAGKSTLVKILMTIIKPSNAVGTVLGNSVGHKPTLARIGYLPEHHRFPDYLTGAQVLDFYGGLTGVAKATRKQRIPMLLELVGMKDWANQAVKKYSKGMRQRVGIAQALMADPEMVILDEPTDGVDPVGRRDIRDLLMRLKSQGKTVFINSHLLSELEMVCDRVAIMVQGKVAMQGTVDDLTIKQRWYEIECEGDVAIAARVIAELGVFDWRGTLVQKSFAGMAEAAAGRFLAGTFESSILFGTDEPGAVQPCIDALRAKGVTIRQVNRRRPSLEDLFMQAVTDPTTGGIFKPGARGGAGANVGGSLHGNPIANLDVPMGMKPDVFASEKGGSR